jgi:anti-sigma factor RsiW
MTEARQRGWGLSEHLMPDAVVAFVDGELSPTAYDRAGAHAARCPYCAAEITAQRQARAAVRAADIPPPPAGLIASLRAIPQEIDLSGAPDELAVTEDGQLVAIQRPERAPLGSSAPMGSSAKLGEGKAILGGWRFGRRTAQGAGVVVSGLVLGALALANSGSAPVSQPAQVPPLHTDHPAVVGANVQPVGLVAPPVHPAWPR